MAALGTALTADSWRGLWILYAIAATYALSVALFYVLARYRFPLVPILMILAAGGLVRILDAVRLQRFRRLGLAAAVSVLAVLLARLPFDDARTSRATHYLAIASTLSKNTEQPELAMEYFKRALDQDPRFPAAQFGLGTLLARIGRSEEAIPYYRAALASRGQRMKRPATISAWHSRQRAAHKKHPGSTARRSVSVRMTPTRTSPWRRR